jgi:hypothetical protein
MRRPQNDRRPLASTSLMSRLSGDNTSTPVVLMIRPLVWLEISCKEPPGPVVRDILAY